MIENELKIIIHTTENAKALELCGDFNQLSTKELHSFLQLNAMCPEKVIYDFKNTSEIDLSCIQLIASNIIERTNNKFESDFNMNNNELITEFLSKTGMIQFLESITNKNIE